MPWSRTLTCCLAAVSTVRVSPSVMPTTRAGYSAPADGTAVARIRTRLAVRMLVVLTCGIAAGQSECSRALSLPVVKRRLYQAGARLALVLNEAPGQP